MLSDKELEEIRRKMLELEEEPPVNGWKSIQAEVQPPDTRWRLAGWFGVALLALFTIIGLYMLNDKDKESTSVEQVADAIIQEGAISQGDAPRLEDDHKSSLPAERQERHLNSNDHSSLSKQEALQVEAQRKQTNVTLNRNAPSEGAAADRNRSKERIKPVLNAESGNLQNQAPAYSVSMQAVSAEPETGGNVVKADTAVRESEVGKGTLISGSGAAKVVDQLKTDLAKSELFTTPTPFDSLDTALAPDTVKQEKNAVSKVESKGASSGKWLIGVFFSPRYSFRKFEPNGSDDIYITQVKSADQFDPERMGYEAGANVGRLISADLFLETGLSWMQLKENVTYSFMSGKVDTLLQEQTANGQIKIKPVFATEERQLISSYAYGGLRAGATYFFLQNRQRRFSATLAAGANLLVKGKTKHLVNGEWLETVVFPSKEDILEQSNYNISFGLGYNVSVLTKYELVLMPTINYFLGSTFKEREPLGLRPYSLGINLQLRRHL